MVNEPSVVELLRFDYILYAHSEDSDQTERMRSQISAFDVCIGIGHLAWHGSSLRNWIHVVDFFAITSKRDNIYTSHCFTATARQSSSEK